ncbi:diguanylate cyclase [Sporomusa aerivorans]|uniref:diguanylate cyclase n=1 Tax=Sporomusa aerivorans TaxID=204936 RepID=UPI00352AA87E
MDPEKQTVLIVDDMKFSRHLLKSLLEDDYYVLCASSGRQALELIMAQPVDLVLLDIIMPDMDGRELCRQLKSDPVTQDVAVIFISVKDETEDQMQGFALGAIDYITKNTAPAVVQARVRCHLELKKQRDRLAKWSFTDALTGIPNRRYFDETLGKLWCYALRNQDLLSCLLIDIDFFKNYNDSYGHMEGDHCLKKVAGAVQAALLRPIDTAARYGGEEFIVLMPSTPCAGAVRVAERIQANIRELRIEHRLSGVSNLVTVSIGIATLKPDRRYDPAVLIKRADFGLYKAKNEGRNRFVIIE